MTRPTTMVYVLSLDWEPSVWVLRIPRTTTLVAVPTLRIKSHVEQQAVTLNLDFYFL